jgi:pimeloyl-ACP methyl ester carboxylesterase
MTPIVMVHGAFCGGWSFETFKQPFLDEGFRVICPDLRGHGAHEPHDTVIGVSMRDYAADVAALCAGLDEPPILVGHSMGGLVAQLAARRVELKGLVLLAPSPPWGLNGWSPEEAVAAWGVSMLSLLTNGAVTPSRRLMREYSLPRMSRAEQTPILARLRPESAKAVRETLNWWLDPFMTTSLGPGPLHAPSLVLVGEHDKVHPVATSRLTAQRIGGEFAALPDMSHWLLSEPGWERVADAILTWLARETRAAA